MLIYCQAGQHYWDRPKKPGREPKNCPEHQKIIRAEYNRIRNKEYYHKKTKYDLKKKEYHKQYIKKYNSVPENAARKKYLAKKRYKENPDLLLKKREGDKRQQIKSILEAIYHYSNGECRCKCCGNDYIPHLTIDHISGNGCEERRQTHTSTAPRLVRAGFPPGFQILCFSCNFTKHTEGICRCQKREDIKCGSYLIKNYSTRQDIVNFLMIQNGAPSKKWVTQSQIS